jgi:hypothetical protein
MLALRSLDVLGTSIDTMPYETCGYMAVCANNAF